MLEAVQRAIEEKVSKGFSLAKLAGMAKLSRSTLTRWRSGGVIPSWQEADRAIRSWGGDLVTMLAGDDPRIAVLFQVYASDEEALTLLARIAKDPRKLSKLLNEAKFLASVDSITDIDSS